MTLHVFKNIDSIIVGFLWGSKAPRVSLTVLKLPITMGGMALPDLRSYFMASQLSFLHWRLFPLTPNATSLLEAAVAISQETLQNMLYRKGIPGREVGSVMALPGKVFH